VLWAVGVVRVVSKGALGPGGPSPRREIIDTLNMPPGVGGRADAKDVGRHPYTCICDPHIGLVGCWGWTGGW